MYLRGKLFRNAEWQIMQHCALCPTWSSVNAIPACNIQRDGFVVHTGCLQI